MAHISHRHIFLVEVFDRHDFDRNVYREAVTTQDLAREVGKQALAGFQARDPDWADGYDLVITQIRLYDAC